MDAEYDALEAAASSYKAAERDEEGRSHRSHRERDDRERRHRHRDEGDDRHHSRGGENGHRDRDHDRDHRRSGRDEAYGGGGDGYGRERYDDRRGGGYDDGSRRRRRDDGDMAIAEPMHGGSGPPPPRDRRRYDEEPFAAPMRGYGDRPPPQRRRDDGDWRGGGGGGGGGFRDGGRRDNRERRRSFDRRSPTPPGAVPLEDRQREMSLWDIRPHQFEGLGGMEAKRTGMFTYGPGRVPPPSHLGIPTGLIAGSFAPGIGTTQGTVAPARQTKRLYIGGITEQMTEEMLKEFFTKLMEEHKLLQEGEKGEVITEVQINLEKLYAFLEFRTAEEATAAMQFDGVMCEDVALKVKRPKDYIGIDPSLGSYIPGTSNGADSPNKLFIGGLPTYLNDEQVLELLKAFGELRSFNLVKETQGGVQVSKGFAFCEYLDPSITDMAIAGLHNFQLGDRSLVVQRAAVGRNTGIPSSVIPGSSGYLASAAPNIVSSASIEEVTSRCMLLLNMVEPDELYSDEDYNDILEDINEECSKYGEVEGVRVPRPVPKSKKWEPTDSAAATAAKAKEADDEAGVGRVFVLFREVESTKKAMKAIGGRQFAGRTILVASVSEEEFLGPAPPPPPPEDLDAAAADAVKDIMSDLA